jgi:hypothetical protein
MLLMALTQTSTPIVSAKEHQVPLKEHLSLSPLTDLPSSTGSPSSSNSPLPDCPDLITQEAPSAMSGQHVTHTRVVHSLLVSSWSSRSVETEAVPTTALKSKKSRRRIVLDCILVPTVSSLHRKGKLTRHVQPISDSSGNLKHVQANRLVRWSVGSSIQSTENIQ